MRTFIQLHIDAAMDYNELVKRIHCRCSFHFGWYVCYCSALDQGNTAGEFSFHIQ